MYSPKISPVLVPGLYKIAKVQGIAMTTLVNRILAKEIQKLKKKGGEYDCLKGENRTEFPDKRFPLKI